MRFDHLPHLRYRPEIDGLRAIAVLVVILFHAGANLPGGFIGVDIFYVISGFLITKIIVGALHENRFSFAEFYSRRVKRLLPAAFFMLLATVLFGYVILTPDKYLELSKSAVYASIFLANVWFAGHSGYFDQTAEVSPLVHMWSLAVEEQFYLLFPLALMLAYRRWRLHGIQWAIGLVLVLSLGSSLLLSPRYTNFSFYLLPTRAWELSVGAVLVFLPLHHLRGFRAPTLLFGSGAGLILFGLLSVSQEQPYPGWLALFPVIGTALLIAASHAEGAVGRNLLVLRPVVLIGRISYSAYLWHWPIVSYYRVYVAERAFFLHEVVALTIASLAVGYLSWRFIEERFRHRELPSGKTLRYGTYAISVMVALPISVHLAGGFPDRISVQARTITDSNLMWSWTCAERIRPFAGDNHAYCVVGARWQGARVKGIIWGDSHSMHWGPLFHELARERGISLVVAPLGCPPYLNAEYVQEHYPKFPDFTEKCTHKHRLTVDWLNRTPEIRLVVMAAAWSGHVRMLYTEQTGTNLRTALDLVERSGEVGGTLSIEALRRTLASIDLRGRRVLLLGDVPRPNRNLNECAFVDASWLLRAPCEDPYDHLDATRVRRWHKVSDEVLTRVAGEFNAVDAIIPVSVFCNDTICPTYLDGELLYKDSNHIRRNLTATTVQRVANELGLPTYLDSL
jgi:peptidoglycan/LPS O-acetylase OafA/YrhL